MVEVKFKRGILYLCVHKRIFESSGFGRVLSKEKFNLILSRIYHIPKRLQPVVLKEMVELGIIKEMDARINHKRQIKITFFDDNLVNTSELYESVGLYH